MVKKLFIFFILVSFTLIFWPFNRFPYLLLPPITQEYYECVKCHSLIGGIFGKGPLKTYQTHTSILHIHRWVKVSQEKFKKTATEKFNVNWSKEIPFWNR